MVAFLSITHRDCETSVRRANSALLFAILFATLTSAWAGTFKNPAILPTLSDPCGVVAGDFNRDGNQDILYGDGTDTASIHVLLGNGKGAFTHGQDLELPAGIRGGGACLLNIGDLNGDGILDLIVGGDGSSTTTVFAVMLGNGDGTFQSPIVTEYTSTLGLYPSLNGAMAIGDINGDGIPDLVIPDGRNDYIYIFLGDGTGHFTYSFSFFDGGTPKREYLYDLNGDGNLDLVSIGPLGATATVFLGKGHGAFQPAVRYSVEAGTEDILLADLDGDGHPDLVGMSYPGDLQFLKGNSDGTFATSKLLEKFGIPLAIAGVNKYDSSGNSSVALLSAVGVSVSLNSGDLSFGNLKSSVAGAASFQNYAEADFNGDGRLDVALGVDGGIALLMGSGDGTFVSADFL